MNNNLNLVRFFAFAVSPEYALQPSPGQYSEAIFRGLDYALEQLRSRGLKVCAALRIMLAYGSQSTAQLFGQSLLFRGHNTVLCRNTGPWQVMGW